MNQTDADRMMQMITGYWVTQVVHAAATFSIADHLAKATAEDIADAERTDPSATFRLLRTCASLGMVKYDGNSRFAGTSLLDTLRKDNPQSLRAIAVSWRLPGHWLPWGRFAEAVKTGKSQAVPALGAGLFEYFATNPAEATACTESMTSLTSAIAKETARLINVSGVNTVADIGGAGGAMLHTVSFIRTFTVSCSIAHRLSRVRVPRLRDSVFRSGLPLWAVTSLSLFRKQISIS